MKKILITIVALILVTFTFVACGSSNDVAPGAKTEVLVGILSEQAPSDDLPGTHLLMDETLKVHTLSSIALNLSDPKYLSNKVEIYGVDNPDDNIFNVTGISVLELLSEVDDSNTVEFVEYKNSDYGFTLKYNNDWIVLEEGSKVTFASPEYEIEDKIAFDTVFIDQFQFSYSQSVFDSNQNDSPLANFLATNFPEFTNMEPLIEYVGVEGTEAVRMQNDHAGYDYYMYRNGLIYQFSFIPYDALVKSDNEIIFKKMLSEFKFIGFTVEDNLSDLNNIENIDNKDEEKIIEKIEEEVNDVAIDLDNFTYFDSLPYSFRAVYPSSWYYAGSSSSDTDVRHHYGFSTETLEEGNELISLDVMSGGSDGQSSGADFEVFKEIDGQTYRVSGDKEYTDYINAIANSIEALNENL